MLINIFKKTKLVNINNTCKIKNSKKIILSFLLSNIIFRVLLFVVYHLQVKRNYFFY